MFKIYFSISLLSNSKSSTRSLIPTAESLLLVFGGSKPTTTSSSIFLNLYVKSKIKSIEGIKYIAKNKLGLIKIY